MSGSFGARNATNVVNRYDLIGFSRRWDCCKKKLQLLREYPRAGNMQEGYEGRKGGEKIGEKCRGKPYMAPSVRFKSPLSRSFKF